MLFIFEAYISLYSSAMNMLLHIPTLEAPIVSRLLFPAHRVDDEKKRTYLPRITCALSLSIYPNES